MLVMIIVKLLLLLSIHQTFITDKKHVIFL